MSFALDISKWVSKAGGNADLVTRKVVLDIFGRVIKRTPVDTGRLKGNWQYAEGSAPAGVIEAMNRSPLGSVGSSAAMLESKVPQNAAGKVYYLVNNLPYAERIENGYSGQAPQGMVKLTVMEFEVAVNKAAGDVR